MSLNDDDKAVISGFWSKASSRAAEIGADALGRYVINLTSGYNDRIRFIIEFVSFVDIFFSFQDAGGLPSDQDLFRPLEG